MKNEKLTASRPSPKLSRPPTRFVSPRMTRRASNPPLLASTNVQKQSPNAIHHNPNHESNTITPPLHYCGQLCQHPPSNPKIRTKHSNFSNSEQFRAIPTKCDLRNIFPSQNTSLHHSSGGVTNPVSQKSQIVNRVTYGQLQSPTVSSKMFSLSTNTSPDIASDGLTPSTPLPTKS